jgi:hypothetical protein
MNNAQGDFQGELREAILPALLRYMQQKKLTGMLQLRHASGVQGMVWVAAGEVVDARTSEQHDGDIRQPTKRRSRLTSENKTTDDVSGLTVLAIVATWYEGSYSFTPGEMADERTITLSLPDILATLSTDKATTATLELDPSVICAKREGGSERFRTLNIMFQQLDLTIFLEVDGERSLKEIAEALKLPIDKVYSSITHLLEYQLISRVNQPAQG